MVLEEPPSDPDPYSSTDPFQPTSSTTHSLDLSTLPHPIPFAQLWGYTEARTRRRILSQIAKISARLGRPLRTDELDAVSYHTARTERLGSIGPPLGVAAGGYRATANAGRFPLQNLIGQNTKFALEGGVLSYAGRELLRGPQVVRMVESVRVSLYAALGYWIGNVLCRSYGSSVATMGLMQDRRMEDLRTQIQKSLSQQREVARSSRAALPGEAGAPRRDPTGQGRWREHRTAIGANPSDDASPTAGTEDFFGGARAPDVTHDPQVRSREQRPQAYARRSPAANRNPSPEREEPAPPPRDFASDYIPAAPSTDDPSSYASSSAGGGGESAWERIRRENASGSGPMRRQEGSTTLGDSFSFSSTEEERSYAKAEAQKQFDERVEQERRGEDFGARGSRRG